MDYKRIPGNDATEGVDIRLPVNDDYRTCAACGRDCEPEIATDNSAGVRIVFSCRAHGPQGIVDPFIDER